MSSKPLSVIGPYRLLRLVSAGGEGSVFEAEDTRLERRVAVKLLPREDDPGTRSAQLGEARSLAALAHPFILKLHDVLELPDALALVMELVQGRDLDSVLADGELTPGVAVHLCMDVSSALAAAHDAGICHGDLKAANVLLTGDGHIRLCDFGLVMSSVNQGVSGSAYSLTPEQVRGDVPDQRSDLFGLGCLLHRLLYGEYPFPVGGADWREQRLAPAATPDSAIAAGLPEELNTLVRELLASDSGLRPASAHVVRQRLLAISRAFPAGEIARFAGQLEQAAVAEPSALYGGTEGELRGRFQRYRIPALALGAVALLGTALYPDPLAEPSREVRIEGVYVSGSPVLGATRLETLLAQVVADDEGFLVSGDDEAAVITLHVECATEVCSSQLLWRSDSTEMADTRALLVSASAQVWERRLRQGLREFSSP